MTNKKTTLPVLIEKSMGEINFSFQDLIEECENIIISSILKTGIITRSIFWMLRKHTFYRKELIEIWKIIYSMYGELTDSDQNFNNKTFLVTLKLLLKQKKRSINFNKFLLLTEKYNEEDINLQVEFALDFFIFV